MRTERIKSYDGTEIFVSIWDEIEKPKGVIEIAHGMCEYAGRYHAFAEFLNSRGYIVFAEDHRAHGRTETKEEIGRHKGFIFEKSVNDLIYFGRRLKEKYNLPVFYLGHSYGSLLGQSVLEESASGDFAAFALLGSAYMPTPLVNLGRALLFPLYSVAKDWRPAFVRTISDGLFGLKYKGDKGPSQWLTRDMERRQNFIDDEYCGIDVSINFFYSMMKGIAKANKTENTLKINPDIPIALFSGDMDPIGGYGKKINALYNHYKQCGVKNVTLHLYSEARHEVINELEKETVYNDIAEFFDSCLNNQSSAD